MFRYTLLSGGDSEKGGDDPLPQAVMLSSRGST